LVQIPFRPENEAIPSQCLDFRQDFFPVLGNLGEKGELLGVVQPGVLLGHSPRSGGAYLALFTGYAGFGWSVGRETVESFYVSFHLRRLATRPFRGLLVTLLVGPVDRLQVGTLMDLVLNVILAKGVVAMAPAMLPSCLSRQFSTAAVPTLP